MELQAVKLKTLCPSAAAYLQVGGVASEIRALASQGAVEEILDALVDILAQLRDRALGHTVVAHVLSVGVDGATVTQIAQRHEITRQQIYAWRYGLKKKGLLSPDAEVMFLPIEISRMAPAPEDRCASGANPALIEVVLRNGRCLRVDAHVDASALTHLIQIVEAA